MSRLRSIPNYTLEDWQQWEGRWELWYGCPVAMPASPTFEHAEICAELVWSLRNQLRQVQGCGCTAVTAHDWRMGTNAVVRPDVMVVRKRPKNGWVEDPPELLIEVASPSTRDNDLRGKLDIYRDGKVRHYLVVDPADMLLRRLLGADDEDTPDELIFDLHDGCRVKLSRKVEITTGL